MRTLILFLLYTLPTTAIVFPLSGQVAFSVIFRQQDEAQESLVGGTWEEFLEHHKQKSAAGFELQDLEPVTVDNQVRFWASWSKTGKLTIVERAKDWPAMIRLKNQKAAAGWVLENLEAYTGPYEENWYIGIWTPGSINHKAIRLTTRAGLEQSTTVLARQFYYLVDIEVVRTPAQDLEFLCLFQRRSPDWRSFLVLTNNEEAFYEQKYQRNRSGYQLIDLETFVQEGEMNLLGLFRRDQAEENCRLFLDWSSLQSYHKFLGEDYAIADLEASAGAGILEAPPLNQTRIATTPNISHQVIIPNTVDDQNGRSAACAAVNALLWLAQNGYPNLLPTSTRSSARIVSTMTNLLADEDHMKSLQPGIFSIYSLIDGLVRYSAESNYRIKTIKVQNLRYFDERQLKTEGARARIEIDDQHTPTLEFARTGFLGNSLVLIQWGIYQITPRGDFQQLKTNWGTLVGYGADSQGQANPKMLIIHSPAHNQAGALFIPVEKLINTLTIPTGAMLNVPASSPGPSEPVPANYARMLSGLSEEENAAFAVWESTIILEYEDPRIAQILQQISQDD